MYGKNREINMHCYSVHYENLNTRAQIIFIFILSVQLRANASYATMSKNKNKTNKINIMSI